MPAPHSSADTPVMRQYLDIKARYPDAIVMFRMGDFYEMFFEDAVTVGPVLDIAVTSRDKGVEDPVPMAGVPYHALGSYLRTLVERGMKVAICEQMETPEEAKKRKVKIVRREVVRVVTPGALIDEEHLDSNEPNYLAAVWGQGERPQACALAFCDISTSDFFVVPATDDNGARSELARFAPKEILAPPAMHPWLREALGPDAPRIESCTPPPGEQRERVRSLAYESGIDTLEELAQTAAAAVLSYAEATQPGQTLLLHRLRRHDPAGHLVLDEASIRNLELFATLRDGQRKGSLLWAMDATQTAMGARMLRGWLATPTLDRAVILDRQDAIEALLAEPRLRGELQSRLKDVRDIVRLTTRARLGTATPRELGGLRDSLAALPEIADTMAQLRGQRIDRNLPRLLELGDDLLTDLRDELEAVLIDHPPSVARDGGIIREGADTELDGYRRLRDGGREALAAIESRERERTQITSLKVQHNRVFGYFLEVPKAHLPRVPSDYVRKQTLANAERYVTEELAGHEARVLGAQAQALAREHELFTALRDHVSDRAERLCVLGERLAQVDALAGLAEVAERHDYCRPKVVEEPVLDIEQGRHPVVERMLDTGRFVPNDVSLRAHASGTGPARAWLITGPNMGGKSTVMRQAALIAILAHTGSFVPAAGARVGLIDRVFTRVGAADDLARGESTFMVEMRETAQILGQATARSLVILDEVGRGTATFDGLALAWAIVEHLHDQVGCRTMFATHYHELCALEGIMPGIQNVHVTVHEHRGKIVFLHRVERGSAGRSYGIAVGRLAGLPARVLRRAARILDRLEADPHVAHRPQLDLFTGIPATGPASATPMRPSPIDEFVDELRVIDIDELSPKEAHDRLRELVERVQK